MRQIILTGNKNGIKPFNMMKKWLKILPVICLLIAQLIVAAHIHTPDEAIAEHECIYCQTAAELAGSNTPQIITIAEPIYYQSAQIIFSSQPIIYFHLSYQYDTRAPPLA